MRSRHGLKISAALNSAYITPRVCQRVAGIEQSREYAALRNVSARPIGTPHHPGLSSPHASLHLHRLRHAVSAVRDSAGCVSGLHRRAAVRPGVGPVLDHAGAVCAARTATRSAALRRGSRPSRPPRRSAIGQRAILVRTPSGNVLWDCIALIDEATVDVLKGLGGIAAIAISHPHYYTTMVEWSRALGGVPIHLHAADRQWVMRADPAVQFWDGDTKQIGPGLTLVRLGGHFDGGTVLHWADGCEGRGMLLSGDILQVVPSGHVSFMWSYPNLIPLSAAKVRRMAGDPGAVRVRRGLRRVLGAGADRRKRQAGGSGVGHALHCAHQRDIGPLRASRSSIACR